MVILLDFLEIVADHVNVSEGAGEYLSPPLRQHDPNLSMEGRECGFLKFYNEHPLLRIRLTQIEARSLHNKVPTLDSSARLTLVMTRVLADFDFNWTGASGETLAVYNI
jgi:hypothetical protein